MKGLRSMGALLSCMEQNAQLSWLASCVNYGCILDQIPEASAVYGTSCQPNKAFLRQIWKTLALMYLSPALVVQVNIFTVISSVGMWMKTHAQWGFENTFHWKQFSMAGWYPHVEAGVPVCSTPDFPSMIPDAPSDGWKPSCPCKAP